MSIEQARAFIEKMKSNEVFRECVLALKDVEERLAKCRTEGFDCTLEDIEALQSVCIDSRIPGDNLPLTWQSPGPCHTKCAPVT